MCYKEKTESKIYVCYISYVISGNDSFYLFPQRTDSHWRITNICQLLWATDIYEVGRGAVLLAPLKLYIMFTKYKQTFKGDFYEYNFK
mgnify:CR=1 FL=1